MPTKFNLDRFKMGYVIRYKNDGSKFSNMIEKKQLVEGFKPGDACYNHVEVSGGEQHSVNISPPKAKHIDIRKVHKGRYIQLLKYNDPEFDNGKRYKVAYFSALLCNKGYDFGGLGAFLFKWIKQSNRFYFCSEGVAWSFKKVFPKIFGDRTPDKIFPADFNKTNGFDIIWEGKIPD